MPTILELLEQKQGVVPSIPSKVNPVTITDEDTSTTLKERYESDTYKFGTNYSKVKADTETLIEQETSGIRIKSAADLPNPILYGNEVIRITARTTPLLDDMKGAANGGGLIGKGLGKLTGGAVTSVSGIASKFNSLLGIPVTMIPSRLIGKIQQPSSNKFGITIPELPSLKPKPNSQDPITKSKFGGGGTLLGKVLKKSGGGTPKTIVKNVAGAAVKQAKEKIRGALFGGGDVKPNQVTGGAPYNNDELYSTQLKNSPSYTSTGDPADFELEKDKNFQTTLGIDLSRVSPVHGVSRMQAAYNPLDAFIAKQLGRVRDVKGRFGDSNYAFQTDKGSKAVTPYSPLEKENYSFIQKNTNALGKEKKEGDKVNGRIPTLEERGIRSSGDTIAMGDPYTTTINKETNEVEVDGIGKVIDLIPLFIGRYNSSTYPMMAFRCAITGLTETSSPSWASNNFVGNPYKYYIFESVERSVSFNLQIYAQNQLELANNWSKLSNLTKLSYPLIEKNMAHPNFTQFTLGDMYKDKVCIVESLSYTFPDNGTWETNAKGLLLPKFIDVAITLKFVENIADGSVDGADTPKNNGLYSYPKNKNAKGADKRDKNGTGKIASQHQIYQNADRFIKYHTIDEAGKEKEISKLQYGDEVAAGSRVGIKIKVPK
jgi:hypothetical protein